MPVSREQVIAYYRLILGRDPESEAVLAEKMRHPSPPALRTELIGSAEFADKLKGLLAVDPGKMLVELNPPPLPIAYRASEAQLAACVAKIRAAWSHLGEEKPHFSVISKDRYLPENLAGNLDAFWASGENEAAAVEALLARYGLGLLAGRTCVEYGCGVGRVTAGLARRFGRVHAYDISHGHLALAEAHMAKTGLHNCRFHLTSDDVLAPLQICDAFYSRIVFQHNPPPMIFHLVRNALRSLAPGGIGIFQVPTYIVGYRFDIDEWIAIDHPPDMQMHCLPQEVIFDLIAGENCVPLEVREEGSTGRRDKFVSNRFVVRKV